MATKSLNQPVNNVINRAKNIIGKKTPFVIIEAYKSARTNLMFSLATCDKKIIVFTSCSPKEGKSTSCINIAMTMAQMGSRVLMIDADLRKPTAHYYLNQNSKNGLSSILGGFCSVLDAINIDVKENLDLISAGPIPPNPAELLASQNMKQLLEYLSEQYDYIFIDTPPVNVVIDSQLMNDIVAGIVFVVKDGSTTHPEIEEALRNIELAHGKVLGFMKVGCGSKGSMGYKSYKYSYKKYESYDYSYGDASANDVADVAADEQVNG